MEDTRQLTESLKTSFMDATHPSDEFLRVSLLSNIPGQHKVLEDLESELSGCESFSISVAFITLGGITPLLQILKELEEKNVPGRILTTDYLSFTQPAALHKLLSLGNIELRIYRTGPDNSDGFHTKGYIFERDETLRLIVGSSNLTDRALSLSREWNTRLVCLGTGEFARSVLKEFDELWNHEKTRPARDILADYEQEYKARLVQMRALEKLREKIMPVREKPVPNSMQQAFLERLAKAWKLGQKRALLISATGTGKTYAAAFAIRDFQPRRLLFVVHREQIARQARSSFMRVLGGDKGEYGIMSGTVHEENRRYVFATMQTLARKLNDFAVSDFDFIIIDEVHRAGAPSYQKIMAHFQPRFWLGMTGSPDRPDGFDIYGLFDYNIVYEIRLQDAMKNDLLCPFHYFGIGDLAVQNTDRQYRAYTPSEFMRLEKKEYIRHIIEKAKYYGYCGERVKGLVFASSRQKAWDIAQGLNENGYRALALSGDDSQDVRDEAVRRLTSGNGEGRLDYLVTVDIFNEGVDLPEVNQILLLRPTQSPIIFVQQLGRGLRKHEGKDFVVVLDFIGDYDNNYLIPVALSGDLSYRKDRLRRIVSVESRHIPGISSIHFDRIARERIYQAIDRAKTSSMELLREAYLALKNKLGRVPNLTDYEEHGQIDAVKFLQKGTGYSYHSFLARVERNYQVRLTQDATRRIAWLSRKLGNAVRLSETIVLRSILEGEHHLKANLVRRLAAACGYKATQAHLQSVENMLTNNFERTEQERARQGGMTFIAVSPNGEWEADPGFVQALEDANFKHMVEELCTFVERRWQALYSARYKATMLSLGASYTYDDVCRLLDWDKLMPAQNIGGYFYHAGTKTLPIFINYDKPSDAIPYEDRFLSRQELLFLSKTNRRADSDDARRMTRQKPYEDTTIYLFVRKNKNDNEAKSFYFLGEIEACSAPHDVTLRDGKGRAFEIRWKLQQAVEQGLYEYLTGE